MEIALARPGLEAGSAEWNAALLLLAACELGFNVDRVAGRTRLPRSFVSRSMRRLADNGLLQEGRVQCDWRGERAASPHFWLDVQVALGQSLRRLDGDGNPEWAPIGGWVKDFEYAGRGVDRGEIHTTYRFIPAHDPEPVVPEEDEVEEAEPAPPPPAPARTVAPAPRPAPPPAPRPQVPAGAGVGGAMPSGGGFLVGDWGQANWLG